MKISPKEPKTVENAYWVSIMPSLSLIHIFPSSNLGKDFAMFEAVHGSAPDIAGQGIANPTAFLWSACMLLEHIGKNDVAAKIRKAVDLVLEDGSVLTPDIGGTATTIEYEKAIIAHL